MRRPTPVIRGQWRIIDATKNRRPLTILAGQGLFKAESEGFEPSVTVPRDDSFQDHLLWSGWPLS
jgi:hypothetical protein